MTIESTSSPKENPFPLNREEFVDWLSVNNLKHEVFLGDSFNHVFLAEHNTYGEVVVRFWQAEEQKADSLGILGLESSGYLARGKYRREKELLNISHSKLGKGPIIYQTGQIAENIEWCIQSKLEGTPLDKLWGELDEEKKFTILEQIGLALSQIHQTSRVSEKDLMCRYWLNKVEVINNNLRILNIFPDEELVELSEVTKKGLNGRVFNGSSFMGTTHLEIILKHIFVDPESLNVNGFVDWETGELNGDQMSDLAYATFWNSNEGVHRKDRTDLTNPQYFDAILKGYSTFLNIDKDELMDKLPIYDLLWYMNILWIRVFQGENINTERRKTTVLEIAKSLK